MLSLTRLAHPLHCRMPSELIYTGNLQKQKSVEHFSNLFHLQTLFPQVSNVLEHALHHPTMQYLLSHLL